MFEDQPWMQDIPSMGNVNKKGKPSRVKAKRAFGKIEDPSEIGYNDDVRYKGTQAQQAADRAYNLAVGTTGYDAVHVRLEELDSYLKEIIPNYNKEEMFNELKRFNIRTVKDKLDKIAQMNAALKAKGITDPAELYSSGHGYSRAAGGPATARNFGFPELGKDNYKTQNRQDLSKADLEEIGIDTSWSMFVDRYLSDVYAANLIQKTDAQRYLKDTDLLLWSYTKNNVDISLLWDSIYNDYVFSFPLQNSKYNYVMRFRTLDEGNKYMKYILEEYI